MIAALFLAGATLPSTLDLGVAAGRCRVPEIGPAFLVAVEGLRDRRGRLKLELYPAHTADFLADDNVLVNAGKPFARVEVPVPASGPVELCIRSPHGGMFALSLLHDRNGDHRFTLSTDGIGFSRNPQLGWSKPAVAAVEIAAEAPPTHLHIRLNYRAGLFSFRPLAG